MFYGHADTDTDTHYTLIHRAADCRCACFLGAGPFLFRVHPRTSVSGKRKRLDLYCSSTRQRQPPNEAEVGFRVGVLLPADTGLWPAGLLLYRIGVGTGHTAGEKGVGGGEGRVMWFALRQILTPENVCKGDSQRSYQGPPKIKNSIVGIYVLLWKWQSHSRSIQKTRFNFDSTRGGMVQQASSRHAPHGHVHAGQVPESLHELAEGRVGGLLLVALFLVRPLHVFLATTLCFLSRAAYAAVVLHWLERVFRHLHCVVGGHGFRDSTAVDSEQKLENGRQGMECSAVVEAGIKLANAAQLNNPEELCGRKISCRPAGPKPHKAESSFELPFSVCEEAKQPNNSGHTRTLLSTPTRHLGLASKAA